MIQQFDYSIFIETVLLLQGSKCAVIAFSMAEMIARSWNLFTDYVFKHVAKAVIKRKLILLEDLAASVAHERPKSKMLVYKSLSPLVEFAISLFPVYLQQADVLDLLIGFFLALFDSLKSQVYKSQRTVKIYM